MPRGSQNGEARTLFPGEVPHEPGRVSETAADAVYSLCLHLAKATLTQPIGQFSGTSDEFKLKRTSVEFASAPSSTELPLMTVACHAFNKLAAEVRRYAVAPTPTGSKTTGLRFWL